MHAAGKRILHKPCGNEWLPQATHETTFIYSSKKIDRKQ